MNNIKFSEHPLFIAYAFLKDKEEHWLFRSKNGLHLSVERKLGEELFKYEVLDENEIYTTYTPIRSAKDKSLYEVLSALDDLNRLVNVESLWVYPEAI